MLHKAAGGDHFTTTSSSIHHARCCLGESLFCPFRNRLEGFNPATTRRPRAHMRPASAVSMRAWHRKRLQALVYLPPFPRRPPSPARRDLHAVILLRRPPAFSRCLFPARRGWMSQGSACERFEGAHFSPRALKGPTSVRSPSSSAHFSLRRSSSVLSPSNEVHCHHRYHKRRSSLAASWPEEPPRSPPS